MAGPTVMGIVNATPDSFSDGGLYLDREAAVEHGLRLAREGAACWTWAASRRGPGAEPVGEAEELARVLPVVERLAAGRGAGVGGHHQARRGARPRWPRARRS